MPFQVNVVNPLGGLDTDTDLAKVRSGDYVGALNIQHISQGGQTTWAIENTLGNKYRFTIPATPSNLAQDKIYRIHLGADGVTSHTINFFWTNGVAMASATFTEGANIAATQANLQAAVDAALLLAAYGVRLIPVVMTYTLGVDYIELQYILGAPYYYDWSLTTDDFGDAGVVQPAIQPNTIVGGEANIIGSFDLLGDLFIWSTNETGIPNSTPIPEVSITVAVGNPLTDIVVVTAVPHGLVDGQEIFISGVLGLTNANGTWIVEIVNPTQFKLVNSGSNGLYTGGGTVFKLLPKTLSEIGVATYDANTDATTYTTLIKTDEFNFTTLKQIDTYCEENNFQKSLYWTDDYNVPRAMYYRGAYMANGFLSGNNPDGIYELGSIDAETRLILSVGALKAEFINQVQTSGAVLSGNWRYAVRLLTETFEATNWTDLTNPVSVYTSVPASVTYVSGDDAGTITPKINEIQVSNIPVDAFRYIELAGVNYVGTAVVGQVIKRVPIDSPTMVIQHTGNETNTTNLDVATLNGDSFDILTAKNIDALDNRLILSNLTTSADIDFSEWTETWTHTLFKESLTAVRYTDVAGFQNLGEYANPQNVNKKVGYMFNETYRFFAKFKLKGSDFITKSFWIDDIKFDTTTPARRNGTFADYDLSNAAGTIAYTPALEFETIDLDFLVNGVPVRNLIETIYIERVECVPEILFGGIGILGINNSFSDTVGTIDASVDGFGATYNPNPGQGVVGEVVSYRTQIGPLFLAATIGSVVNTTPQRRHVSVYSPDVLYSNTGYDYQGGDIMINMDHPTLGYGATLKAAGANYYHSLYVEHNGDGSTATPQQVAITSGTILTDGATATIGGLLYSKRLYRGAPINNDVFDYIQSIVFYTAADILHTNANPDYGYYNIQIYRPLTDKYGAKSLNQTVPTGASYQITSSSPGVLPIGAGIKVFGGDVFTQRSYVKNRFVETSALAGSNLGFFQGFSFYSQNRVNTQMSRRYNSSSNAWLYPRTGATTGNWLADNSTILGPFYDKGYNIFNEVNVNVAFDASLPNQSDLPTQIRYSNVKPQNSVSDEFRRFLPLNFKDLPQTWGEIVHHVNFNGELFTFQQRMVQRQYFNTRGTMSVDANGGSTDVLIGDGSVFSRDGQMVTRIGATHKWGIIKGKSAQGNDSMYWPNTEMKKIVRMGYDGTISLGDIYGMRSFLANNTEWIAGKDNPANGEGISAVWDDRYSEAIWTMRGKRVVPSYDPLTTYANGDVVAYTPTTFSTFEQTGEFYRSLINANIGNTPDAVPQFWELIPHTDNRYYNEYTLAYNEQKNKFTTFYTFKPKIYLKWTDTFFSPRPVSDTGNVYEHRLGRYCIWYDQSGNLQSEDGYIELLFNRDENLMKLFFAILINSEIVPLRIEYKTKDQETFVTATDFEQEVNFWMAAIKQDIITSSTGLDNEDDTSDLFGQYIRIKIYYQADVYQKAVDVVMKYLGTSRTYRK
jgi:hypothetical protein